MDEFEGRSPEESVYGSFSSETHEAEANYQGWEIDYLLPMNGSMLVARQQLLTLIMAEPLHPALNGWAFSAMKTNLWLRSVPTFPIAGGCLIFLAMLRNGSAVSTKFNANTIARLQPKKCFRSAERLRFEVFTHLKSNRSRREDCMHAFFFTTVDQFSNSAHRR